ncbi:MAG: indole-3-glycerol phosphate synthase TrpC [Spirochaetaceae bacterium]|jgi:indole-3-glycerol phosphate synthase|nr:indole-3-glycerol phosphate synthase TrpC [Spirochaetaceae bacterium]
MILDEIADKTRIRVASRKRQKSIEEIRDAALALVSTEAGVSAGLVAPAGIAASSGAVAPTGAVLPFEDALMAPGLSFICEVKRASPSKGMIAPSFPYLAIAGAYEEAGAAAVSVLTEPDYFLGSDQYLKEIAGSVSIPVLRKDFIIDPYQLYEAKLIGADAVLLICALLDAETLASFLELARSLVLAALVEVHSGEELSMALASGARVIGINNRDLKTFTVDLGMTERLRPLIPQNRIVVSESGVHAREDVARLERAGIDALLVGESMMRAVDKKKYLAGLRGVYSLTI